MKTIYIDGLFYKASGIGRYYSNIVKVLANDFKITTFVPLKYMKEWKEEFGKYKNIEVKFVGYEKLSLKGMLRNKVLKELGADIYFFPQINTPFFFKNKNTVTTVHDLIPFHKIWGRGGLKRYLIGLFYKNAIKKSKSIIAISNETKKDILKFFNINNKRIKVIYNFIDDEFCSIKNEKPLIDKRYILFVGNRKKHKNLRNFLYAFSEIKIENLYLAIAGSKDKDNDDVDKIISELGLKDKIIEFIKPSDKELLNLYANTELFVFPSLYEGFGYPPLEAAICNSAVLASNIPILKEILGEEIAVFDPDNIESIKNYLEKVLNDDDYKQYLIEKGKKRVEKFKKSKIANKYIEFFKGL